MSQIAAFEDYKAFVNLWIETQGKPNSRGQFRRMAGHLRVHPSLLTLIFRGSRDLTPEQAADLAQYLGLSEWESEYFLVLVEKARAGRETLRGIVESRRQRLLLALPPLTLTTIQKS